MIPGEGFRCSRRDDESEISSKAKKVGCDERTSEMSKVLTGKGDDYYQRQLGLSGVQSSFDADSLPDYSEFDSESVTLDYFKER